MITQKSKVEEIYKKWNDDLYQKYIQLFPEDKHTTIWDGVIDPASYTNAPFKIMFLNKEAYDEEGNDYDVSEALFSAIKAEQRLFPNQTALRTHFKQYLCVMQSIDSESLCQILDEEMRERVAKQTTDEKWFNTRMAQVAYCNVKKSDGKPNSTAKDLRNYAKKGLDILKEQIRFFNPSIILAGNVCEGILEDLVEWGENLYIEDEHSIAIWQIKIDGKCYPFVDMYHPSNVQGMSEYYLNLLHALQTVEEQMPGFWANRLGRPCFDMNETIKTPTQLPTNNEAEEWFNKGKAAAERKEWRKAVEYYNEAAKLGNALAYRELGEFFENKFWEDEALYLDEYFDQFDTSHEDYYVKAAEYGDKEMRLKFVEKYIPDITKLSKVVNSVLAAISNPFKAKNNMQKTNENAELAVSYMNKLIQDQYKPALDLLENWKQSANDESDSYRHTAKGILEHLNF